MDKETGKIIVADAVNTLDGVIRKLEADDNTYKDPKVLAILVNAAGKKASIGLGQQRAQTDERLADAASVVSNALSQVLTPQAMLQTIDRHRMGIPLGDVVDATEVPRELQLPKELDPVKLVDGELDAIAPQKLSA